MSKKVIIYSHGFGVQKDARGIFTAIAAVLPGVKHVLFDYNEVEADKKVLTVPSVPVQVAMLQRQINAVKKQHGDAELILIGHSFGCVIAGMADLSGIEKVILIAPPINLNKSANRFRILVWPRLRFTLRGEIKLRRRDGVTIVITRDYRKSRKGIVPAKLYNALAEKTEVIVVGALKDKLVGKLDFSQLLPAIKIAWINGDHNFKNGSRDELVEFVAKVVRR